MKRERERGRETKRCIQITFDSVPPPRSRNPAVIVRASSGLSFPSGPNGRTDIAVRAANGPCTMRTTCFPRSQMFRESYSTRTHSGNCIAQHSRNSVFLFFWSRDASHFYSSLLRYTRRRDSNTTYAEPAQRDSARRKNDKLDASDNQSSLIVVLLINRCPPASRLWMNPGRARVNLILSCSTRAGRT